MPEIIKSQADRWDHGSLYRYSWGGCRCEACKEASARYGREKRAKKKAAKAAFIAQEAKAGRPVCPNCLAFLSTHGEKCLPVKDRPKRKAHKGKYLP